MTTLRPMPVKHGIGFNTSEPVDWADGYRYEQVGNYHNYHVTASRYHWPLQYSPDEEERIVDGFSPNLNKQLHVGHLRNLALANSLRRIFKSPNTTFVSLLGCSLGVKVDALKGWDKWTKFIDFKPEIYYDCALPQDVVDIRPQDPESMFPNVGPKVWDGPHGPVLVKRSDGRDLYAFHDLAFANYVGPTHYITGHEQREHFESLGLRDKHCPMGLVLGSDKKKIKSRDGEAFLADDAFNQLKDNLNETPQPDKLAWNVMAWNFLQVKREKNLQFEPEKWTTPTSAGMYITYTYTRILSAFGNAWDNNILSWGMMVGDSMLWQPDAPQEKDVQLVGLAAQYNYYLQKSVEEFDPSPLAQFAHDLAKQLSLAYHSEPIKDGRETFRMSVMWAAYRLRCCMDKLGLFILESI